MTGAASLADEPDFQPPSLRVPEGFVVELVGSPPLVNYPMMAGFDDEGRLYVTDSSGENLSADELADKLPHLIRRLEDTDGDARFDRSTVFADRMVFPEGALWHNGSLFVASPPSIWKLEDIDEDGIADRRTELVTRFPFRGITADIHGCFLGPCGRLYWTNGIFFGHEIVGPDGRIISQGKAARVFSCLPDGSDVETYCGGGMANPVEVAFNEQGDMIGTMTFFNPDDSRHDALVHLVYGGVYPRNDPGQLSEFKRTGPLLPALKRYPGPVAPSGVTWYRSDKFGKAYQNNAFSTQFGTHRVVRHVLQPSGATYRCDDHDFLVSDSPDFRPTDVLEDADGSLLVVDTGGWFTIGCQTLTTPRPQIRGGIYRIRRADSAVVSDPRGLALDWKAMKVAELIDLLGDRRWAVRDRAVEELTHGGDNSVVALAKMLTQARKPAVHLAAVSALSRIDSPESRAVLCEAASNKDATVRQAIAVSLGTLRDPAAVMQLVSLVTDEALPVRREAAAALGRIRWGEAVPVLLDALRSADDPFLEHALVYALIQINDPQAVLSGLSDPSPQVRRGALVALDQMDDGRLTPELVAPLLDAQDDRLLQAALEIFSRQEDWGTQAANLISTWLAAPKLDASRREMLRGLLLVQAADTEIQSTISRALSDQHIPVDTRLLMLQVITRSTARPTPDVWRDPVIASLAAKDSMIVDQAIAAVAACGFEDGDQALLQIAGDDARGVETRVAAAAVLATRPLRLPANVFKLLVEHSRAEATPLIRLQAAGALEDATLDMEQLRAVSGIVSQAGPLELRGLMRAFELPDQDQAASRPDLAPIGMLLLRALEQSPGLQSISRSDLEKLFARYPDEVQASAQALMAKLAIGQQEMTARIGELDRSLTDGDPNRGSQVFFGSRAACSVCHRVQGAGGTVGPDLTGIGKTRTRRELLDSIVMPNASFARGYESFSVITSEGTVYSGVLTRRTAEEITLQTGERKEIQIRAEDVEELAPSSVSIMPAGLEKLLTPDELSDLLAYLRSQP